ncbi:recombinase family protein [Halorubrum sp. SP9]|uniref:recombinase family protein n=2 Tax=unclassified Halorubrum TaxID=2642239 RepID=UPI0010F631F3|nr:recombinase family protein [Halorubrum sp. SP9]TKX68842.1 recombinase family protein [Halorubrum sp. SP9]
MGQRIRPTISAVVQNLKGEILFSLVVSALTMAMSADQAGISDFSEHEITSDRKGIIYARVSSNKQAKEGDSLDNQVSRLREVADELDIVLAGEPIIDDGETGTNFDRDGIQRVFRMAQQDDVEYLLSQNIDRIGRSAAETLYFLHILQSECEVKLITTSGEKDLETIEGLMHTTLMSLLSEVSNEIRTSKAQSTKIRNFLEKKQWSSIYPAAPFGYTTTEDGWLKKDPENSQIVGEMFAEFRDCENYKETRRRINNEYGNVLDGHRVKTLLQNYVYVGAPRIPESWMSDTEMDGIVEDKDLEIVDQEDFIKVQDIIQRKNRKHSTDEDTKDVIDFIEEFDLFTVIQCSDPATLLCDCGCSMVKDGQRDLKGDIKTHEYYCPECDEYRKWPRENEYDRMEVVYTVLNAGNDLLQDGSSFVKYLK